MTRPTLADLGIPYTLIWFGPKRRLSKRERRIWKTGRRRKKWARWPAVKMASYYYVLAPEAMEMVWMPGRKFKWMDEA